MRLLHLNNSGSAILSTVLAGAIGVVSLAYLGIAIISAIHAGKHLEETLVADSYATELLEFFLSQTSDRLRANLSNIQLPGGQTGAYPLCSLVQETIPNPLIKASRFYRVEVVNIASPDNLTSRRDLCGQSAGSVFLSADERFLVTVAVTWDSNGKNQQTEISGIVRSALTNIPTPTPVPSPSPPFCPGGPTLSAMTRATQIRVSGENWPGNWVDVGGADYDDYYVEIRGDFYVSGYQIFSAAAQDITVSYWLGTPHITTQSVSMQIVNCNHNPVLFQNVSSGSGTKVLHASQGDRFNLYTTANTAGYPTRYYDLIDDRGYAYRIRIIR